MKRFFKILTSILAVVMLCVTCLGMVACKENITQVKLTIEVYNAEEHEMETKSVIIDLYEDYAPKTVKHIIKYVKAGYYNNAVFYTFSGESDKIMVGDIKIDDEGNLYLEDRKENIPNTVAGEFEKGQVKGSPLKVKTGSVALWRTWLQGDSYTDSNGIDTGRATWFMPTSDLGSYNGYFCVFAIISKNVDVLTTIKDNIASEDALEYQWYYTGTYDYDKPSEYNGLQWHIEKADDYVEDDSVFVPKSDVDGQDAHYANYASKKIKIAGVGSQAGDYFCGAKIKSAKLI